ncbi:MAG: thioredoxin family protein [Longimicrobiales bacterium]|nr:thioredoxin family protein [Longimicrobiales bacterium]NCG31285.1 redoxin domain-containing protein [Pseudomonadota bacterium]
MSKTSSAMLALGTVAPDFTLPEPATHLNRSLADFAEAEALVVVFLSNHCPFVKHLADHFSAFALEYEAKGVAVVGIMSNDVEKYTADAPDRMTEEVACRGYTFPYLFDESQDIARAYQAACTPDFFLFDATRRLVYRGQYDGSRPSLPTPVTGGDLGAAIDAVLAGDGPLNPQIPSVGCNIKWKAGNAPARFG